MNVIGVEVDVEFDPGHASPDLPGRVQVVAVEPQFREPGFELMKIHSQVQERAEEHVAADATKAMVSDNGVRVYGLDAAALAISSSSWALVAPERCPASIWLSSDKSGLESIRPSL